MDGFKMPIPCPAEPVSAETVSTGISSNSGATGSAVIAIPAGHSAATASAAVASHTVPARAAGHPGSARVARIAKPTRHPFARSPQSRFADPVSTRNPSASRVAYASRAARVPH
jgi:hypothetical protein